MQRLISPILASVILPGIILPGIILPGMILLGIIAGFTPTAMAQVDAQQAYSQAKTSYEADSFEQARDLAQQASETDPENPEVFLLLGKAHYQLGELDEAMAAWRRTLQLAPEQPYAKQMLAVLQDQAAEIDVRIKLADHPVDFAREDIHMAIRYGRGEWAGLDI
ncbi:hypothetical protein LCGC14_3023270, partial [marine sediment metagenome]